MSVSSGRRVAASLGRSGGIAIAVVLLVFLPFAVLAVVRLTGWDWWMAVAALLALNMLPLAGQLATVGLAVVGAFFLGQDELAQRAVPTRAAATVAAETSASPNAPAPPRDTEPSVADRFETWKTTMAGPAIQQKCLEDVQRRGLTGAGQIDQLAKACACYGAAAVNIITPDDVVDERLDPTADFNERLGNEARRICQRG